MINIIANRYKGQEVVDSHNGPHPERTRPSEIFLLMLLKKNLFFLSNSLLYSKLVQVINAISQSWFMLVHKYCRKFTSIIEQTSVDLCNVSINDIFRILYNWRHASSSHRMYFWY